MRKAFLELNPITCLVAVMKRWNTYMIALAAHPRALWVLGVVAFLESSVFPIPPDIILIPMMIINPRRAWLFALVCLVCSVLGGLLGYAIGALFYDSIGHNILAFYGKTHAFEQFSLWYNSWGAWAVLIGGLTPLPYKVITILSGVTGLSLSVFIVASCLARGARFFLLAALIWKFGPAIQNFIQRRLPLVICLALGILLGGFILLKFI